MKTIILDLNEKVLNGEINPLKAYIKLKDIEDTLKEVMKGIKEDALAEAHKYGKGDHLEYGAKFSVTNGRANWDFKPVTEWVNLKADLKAMEEKLKHLAKAKMDVANADTGEIMELPHLTHSEDSLRIKIES